MLDLALNDAANLSNEEFLQNMIKINDDHNKVWDEISEDKDILRII